MQEQYDLDNFKNLERKFLLNIDITSICNFKCEYCYNAHLRDSVHIMSLSAIENIINHFGELLIDTGKFSNLIISLLGGEPIFYPKLQDLLKFLDNCKYCSSIELNTNASRDFSKLNIIPNSKLKFVLSLHPTQIGNYLEIIKSNLQFLKSNNLDYEIFISYYKVDKAKDLIDFLKSNNFKFGYNQIYNPKTGKWIGDFKNKHVNYYYNGKVYSEPELNGKINFYSWTCYPNFIGINVLGKAKSTCLGINGYYKDITNIPSSIICNKLNYSEMDPCCLNYYKFKI